MSLGLHVGGAGNWGKGGRVGSRVSWRGGGACLVTLWVQHCNACRSKVHTCYACVLT